MPFPSAFTTGVVKRDPNTKSIEVTAIYWGPEGTNMGDVSVTGTDWGIGLSAQSGAKIPVDPVGGIVIARRHRQSFTLDVSKHAYFEIRIMGARQDEAGWSQYDFNVFALDKAGQTVPGNSFSRKQLAFIETDDLSFLL